MSQPLKQPNIIIVLVDDLGYSDLGCYGGEIDTPNLDALAKNGCRFSQFYNTPMCSPSRASLLTGLYPHQVGMGILANSQFPIDNPPPGYTGSLSLDCVTIPELLKTVGYGTYISGKWHLSNNVHSPDEAWPIRRGFDHHYGNMNGATSYFYPTCMFRDEVDIESEAKNDPYFYYTDAISNNACGFIKAHFQQMPSRPMFMYVAYTCPHWPLHAKTADIEKYKGRFDEGWDKLRARRLERLHQMKMVDKKWPLTPREPIADDWDDVDEKEWWCRRMEVYAAQIDCMDQGIGQIVSELKHANQFENTLIVFISDNGATREEILGHPQTQMVEKGVARGETRDGRPVIHGNTEEIMPGGEDTHQSYGAVWGNLSNTPFRLYKRWAHEGGVAAPCIFHWPGHFQQAGQIRHQLSHLPDIMATILEITGIPYPTEFNGHKIPPLEGKSLLPVLEKNEYNGKGAIFFEKDGNAAIRSGKWKLVREFGRPWELYDMEDDRTELKNVISEHPDLAEKLEIEYMKWAKRTNVIPYEDFVGLMNKGKKREK